MATFQLEEAREFLNSIQSCKSQDEIQEALNGLKQWTVHHVDDGLVNKLFNLAKSTHVAAVITHVANTVSGTGMRLEGDVVTPELQQHFSRRISEFVENVIVYIIALGFVPIHFILDPNNCFPTFRTADRLVSRFDVFRNKVTKAEILLRWDTERLMYDPMTQFYVKKQPTATGEIDSVATRLLSAYERLLKFEAAVAASFCRATRIVVQKRPVAGGGAQLDSIEETLQEMTSSIGPGKKRKRTDPHDVAEILRLGPGGPEIMVIKDGYQVVPAIANGDIDHPSDSRTALEVYNDEARRFQADVYRQFGLPADPANHDRAVREHGAGRAAVNQDMNRAIGRWTEQIRQAIAVGIELAYPTLFVNDEETLLRLERDRHEREAEAMLRYIDHVRETGEELPPEEDMRRMFRAPSPTRDDYLLAVKDKLPVVQMFPDRRLTPAELSLIQEQQIFDPEQTRRLHAQALGVPEALDDSPEPADAPAPKRPRPLTSRERKGKDEEDESLAESN